MDSGLDRRLSGVLLHPTSLPGPGIGSLGDAAFAWIDWLAQAGQGVWQILPLGPMSIGGSPYDALSAFAGNPWLIDLERLVEEGWLAQGDLVDGAQSDTLDFAVVGPWKDALLRDAYSRFRASPDPEGRDAWGVYCEQNASWLDDYSLFRALREHFGDISWTDWEAGARDRDPEAMRRWRDELGEAIDGHRWEQWIFQRQWRALRAHAAKCGVRILGDLPIYVAHDSADVWAHRHLFRLAPDGRPEVIAGVPPDYFSATGQRWGNPVYDWEAVERNGFAWWTERLRRTLHLVDVVRIDHFRGFAAGWEIPADEATAVAGQWRPGPGKRLFAAVEQRLGRLPLVAEDLGLITPEVEALRDELGLSGMRVLQFAFDGEAANPHLPDNHPPNAVAYTGTHDNDTLIGWYRSLTSAQRKRVEQEMGGSADESPWPLIRLLSRSTARWVIVPLQDLLALGSEARMNTPGVAAGNWGWRLHGGLPAPELAQQLREVTVASGRANML
ncbi:MAG: 4-alpha-glucanotransferase [Longimicrobiaceae bacterium]